MGNNNTSPSLVSRWQGMSRIFGQAFTCFLQRHAVSQSHSRCVSITQSHCRAPAHASTSA
jgi:hypothetical protein